MLGWRPPEGKEKVRQPLHRAPPGREAEFRIDVREVLRDPFVREVLDRWLDVRQYFPEGGLPYAGGVLDGWPAVDVDAFAICYGEEAAIDAWVRYRREHPDA